MFIVEVQFINYCFQYRPAVFGIINSKIIGEANTRRFCAKYAGKYAVKSSDIQVARVGVAKNFFLRAPSFQRQLYW